MPLRNGNYRLSELNDDIDFFRGLAELKGLHPELQGLLKRLPSELNATYMTMKYRDRLLMELLVARKLIAPRLGVLLHNPHDVAKYFNDAVTKREAKLRKEYEESGNGQ